MEEEQNQPYALISFKLGGDEDGVGFELQIEYRISLDFEVEIL